MCAVALWCSAQAQAPALHFGRDGKFRIAQFTDVHLDLGTPYRRAQAEKTIAQMRYILDAEHPDLVVFTGDVVTGKPAAEAWHRVLEPVAERNLPFCVVLGNHDAEQDLTRAEIGRIVTSYAGTLNTLGAGGELADVVLEIAGTTQPAALLYCLDSHSESLLEGIDGYDWFRPEQVAWLRDRCTARRTANGGRAVPSLAFFHIVLPEYLAAWRNPSNTHIGRAAEDECPGALNTGMFAAMIETGSVAGTFVGHDHDIDYLVAEKGVCLGYGRFSGDNTTYNNLRPGVRLLLLTEGERGFETWIREDDGRMVDHARFAEGKITEIAVER